MVDTKKALKVAGVIALTIIALAILGAIVWAILHYLPASLKDIGQTQTSTPIFQGKTQQYIQTLLGMPNPPTLEQLILYLAILMILIFAFAEIIAMFSTFSETTSWAIAVGLGLIASVTKMVNVLAMMFGITAGVGAIGIAIIVIAAVVAAVVINIGLGENIRLWALEKAVVSSKMKTKQGFAEVEEFVRGAKGVSRAAGEGEKGK